VSNPDRYDHHQDDLLSTMAEAGHLIWCRRLEDLYTAIETAQTASLTPYEQCECDIHTHIHQFLEAL
jgi:hypothetical protein